MFLFCYAICACIYAYVCMHALINDAHMLLQLVFVVANIIQETDALQALIQILQFAKHDQMFCQAY